MPTTRTGRQSSPSKDADSPSKMRVQPMRGARLRSASPFFDASSASTSASASQASQASQAASPSKSARTSPRKKVAATASLQAPTRRSTRSRSRSVDPESLTAIDEDTSAPQTRDVSEAPDSETDVSQSQHIQVESEGDNDDGSSPESRLPAITEEVDLPATNVINAEKDDASSKASSDSEDDSASDSDSDSSSSASSDDSSSDSSSDDDDEEDAPAAADLSALLKASQQAYKQRTPAAPAKNRFEDNQDVISFDADASEARDSKRAAKNVPLVVRAKQQVSKSQPGPSKKKEDKLDKQIEALEQGAIPAEVKKSKHARTVQTTAGSNWFDMPEFGASSSRLAALKKQSAADSGHAKVTGGDARLASAEQLRREVQALRLRNALDPKRFYRASAKNQAMPKFAQLGKIIASPLEPKAVLSRKEQGRTVVEELIRDAEAASYAKRKFSESQASHRSNYNGRRKPPSKKKRT
ncbi:uncharacterized conserved protein [Moesziomyces antarcticus T-34]|uniref:Uncharacterized conserved protein n=1 Tax=Pseudozyma antarctica (strain T-34) TaxID=1151754 RepID=M9LUA2_PSEA3|nr:uncharacterized conserved protein [Moesziomyces antarcticus T-34]